MSAFEAGATDLGLLGLALAFDGEGGVDPEESFELIDEIHEFRRPMIGLGALLWTFDGDPASLGSEPLASLLGVDSATGPLPFAVPFGGDGRSDGFGGGGLESEGRSATLASGLD